jgi:hypothetical protein
MDKQENIEDYSTDLQYKIYSGVLIRLSIVYIESTNAFSSANNLKEIVFRL